MMCCSVTWGIVAGYYLLARLVAQEAVDTLGLLGGASEGRTGLAYRLLQLALVFIFTLRNANRIPEAPAKAWGVTEHHIIPAIMQMRQGQDRRLLRTLRHLVPIAPSFRDPGLSIAVVSICAYPEDHPLALPRLTPSNREAYARRHGYALRMHMEHPVIGAHGLGVQHAKLATVLAYLQSNEFDWVAWLDCDSMIMNLDRTLDSLIYQYAQEAELENAAVCGDPEAALEGQWLDSWGDAEHPIVLSRSEALVASAPQIGEVEGRVEGQLLHMDFEGGSLRAEIKEDELLWENGAVWRRHGERPRCREACREVAKGCDAQLLDPEAWIRARSEGVNMC